MDNAVVMPPNHIPVRKNISSKSLSIIGIPKKFHNMTIDSYDDYGCSGLYDVKSFVGDYLKKVPHHRNEPIDGIFFYGSNGVGKTMLASIILKEAYRYRYICRRSTLAKYIDSYTSTWGNADATPEERTWYEVCKSCDFLCLEEVGKEVSNSITNPILEDLLRYREEQGLVTIICTNLTPNVLKEVYGASIMSLIKGNTIPCKIVGKDRRKINGKD